MQVHGLSTSHIVRSFIVRTAKSEIVKPQGQHRVPPDHDLPLIIFQDHRSSLWLAVSAAQSFPEATHKMTEHHR